MQEQFQRLISKTMNLFSKDVRHIVSTYTSISLFSNYLSVELWTTNNKMSKNLKVKAAVLIDYDMLTKLHYKNQLV